MACARCGGFLALEEWGEPVDNARDKRLLIMKCVRCVNCGFIDDPVILGNRLIERSAPCCTTH